MDIHWSTAHPMHSIKDEVDTSKHEFGIPNRQVEREADIVRQFSTYDEVYIGFGRFRKLMRWAGLFPVTDAFDESTTNSTVDGISYSFCSLWSLHSMIVPGMAIFLVFHLGLWHYAFRLSDATETVVFACFLVFFCAAAWINWMNCVVAAPHWKTFFRRFQLIDSLLNIEWDVELRAYGNYLLNLFAAIGFLIGTGLAIATIKQVLFPTSDHANFVATVAFFTFAIGCHFFPEALFMYLCQAINIRLRRSARLLNRLFDENDADIVVGIENVRVAHQLILDSIAELNHLIGPILVAFCIFNTYTLCLCVYFFLLQSISILGMTPWRELLLIISSVRMGPLCMLANKVQERLISNAVHQIESCRYNKKCKTEILFFLTNVETTVPSITAWEFWDVDQGFLTTVSGILLTYAITALQFAKVNKAEVMSAEDSAHYNSSNSTMLNYTMFSNDSHYLEIYA